jgi:UDP-N-acetylmuramate--alanine ligase
VMKNTGTNAGVGQGPYFVIEADEYDRMFLGLRPQIAIVTNVEHDHPDCFPTLQDVRAAFEDFVALLPEDGLLVVCADDPAARQIGQARQGATNWYGVSRGVWQYAPTDGWQGKHIEPDAAGGTRFNVRRGEQEIGQAQIALAGRHNVQNALAVIAVADHLSVPFDRIAAALKSFQGTGRRSEMMGQARGVTVISDYAHHPTAIRVTLDAQHTRPGVRHLWAVWQPHTYGRMRQLADDFAAAFGAADHVLVTDVYSVRETVTPGLDAAGMARKIRGVGDARYTGDLDATARILIDEVQPGDRVVILSAGDAPRIGEMLLAGLQSRP